MAKSSQSLPTWVSNPLLLHIERSTCITDFPTYLTLLSGIMRAGYTPFPLSLRNSPAAITYLFDKTNPVGVFFSTDAGTSPLVTAATAWFPADAKSHSLPVPSYSELFEHNSSDTSGKMPQLKLDAQSPAVLLHSSGTTSAFPKPILWTMERLWSAALYICKLNDSVYLAH